jgi:hypothetical protein
LRQAQNRVLGLPRLKTGCPRQPGHPIPAGIGRHPTPTALTAASFAPITRKLSKSLILLNDFPFVLKSSSLFLLENIPVLPKNPLKTGAATARASAHLFPQY